LVVSGGAAADGDDAHLLTVQFQNKVDKLDYEVFGLHYVDMGDDDGTTYMPNDINYFRSRFTPHLSQLTTIGTSGKYAYTGKGLTLIWEANGLFGKDDVENTAIDARQLVDVNNGDLSGYNVYVKANKDLHTKFTVGGVFGLGSGDDDVTSGDGNVNKLRTSGFFYVTEIWEDSIMPDEEGITPQGLGAPNVRAYRELENTTLFQVNGLAKLASKLKLFASYTYLKATEPIHAWSVVNGATVIDADESSDKLGQEVDWKLDYQLYPQMGLSFRGGVFLPDDAAGYLINGTAQYDRAPWELKGTATYNF
jgi:hypothetical protein